MAYELSAREGTRIVGDRDRVVYYLVRREVGWAMRTTGLMFVVSLCALAFGSSPLRAELILGEDFFETIPHTVLDFNSDGNGEPISLPESNWLSMPPDEYGDP